MATIRFLPSIAPGLPPEDCHAQLSASIEAATNALMVEADRKGIPRPLSPQMRERLTQLRTTESP
jgi:hypothetical protein